MIRRAFFACSLAILGAQLAFSEQVSVNKFRGLNNNDNSVIIDPSEAQDLLNVNISPGGASVLKRDGYGTYKALSTAKPMRGGYHSFDTTGNDVQIWESSTSVYGIVADGTPTQLVSSATLNSTLDCTDTQGNTYCVNSSRDFLLQTNGATKTWYTTVLGTMIDSTPDRLIVAGVSGTPNTLYVSGSNDFTNYTTGVNSASPFTEVIASPGSKLTHIRWGCGKILWWKDQSFGYFDFEDQFQASNKIVSDTIGTFDNTSAIDPGGNVWFRGQDGHTWKYDCSSLEKMSIDITPNVQASGKRTANLWTQTTQADWQAGSIVANGPTNGLSTTISLGNIVPSSITFIDTDSSDFSQGSGIGIDTTTVAGAVTLKTFLNDDFSNFNNWVTKTGTSFPGSMSASGGQTACTPTTQTCQAISTQTITSSFILQASPKVGSSLIWAVNAAGQGYGMSMNPTASSVSIYKTTNYNDSSAWTILVSSLPSTTATTFLLSRDASSVLRMYRDGIFISSFTDVTYSSFTHLVIQTGGIGAGIAIDNVYNVAGQARFTARTFDTFFSTPIYGTFTANATSTGTYAYAVRCSSDPVTSYTVDTPITTGSAITGCSLKRYAIYTSTLTAPGNSVTILPQLTDVSMVVASTGTFYSQVKNATNLNAWSTFGANSSDNGGTHTFYIRSATSTFTTLSSTPTWTAQGVGALVGVSTGTYFQVRDDFTITSGTQVPALNDFTVNWFEGSATDQAYMIYFDNAIWESVAFGSGQSSNNYIFRFDLINEGWTLYNFGAGGLLVQANTLYFGDTSLGNVYNFGTATSDNGTAINAYWKSKDFTGQDPFMQNQLNQIDLFAKKDSGTTLTGTYTTDTSTATAYSVNLSTSNAIVQSRKLLPSGKLGYTFNYKFGDTSASSAWEVLGYRITFTPQPYRPTQ